MTRPHGPGLPVSVRFTWQTPALIVGSVDEIVETLQERRDRWGFNYVVVQQNGGQGLERFNEVISTLAGS